jgi:hypothetical protein
MSTLKGETRGAMWEAVERDRRLDRWIRGVCVAGWSLTLLATLAYAAVVGREVLHVRELRAVGAATDQAVLAAATPLVIALGTLALLVAALATVGVFLRFRTAALGEIQLRLALLEDAVGRTGPAA